MKPWKLSTISGLLLAVVTSLLMIPFGSAIGIGLLIYLYLMIPIIGFCASLFLCHRKGWLWLFPVIFSLFHVLTFSIGEAILSQSNSLDWSALLMIGGFAFFPTVLGTVIGGLMHQKGWLKQPLLVPFVCASLFLIALLVNNAFVNPQAPLILYGYMSALFATMGVSLGLFDKKGYLTPLFLALYFEFLYGFMYADWLNLYLPLYLIISYTCLFMARFWVNSRAGHRARHN